MKALSPRRRPHETYSTCLQWYTLIAGLLEKSMYTKKRTTCAFVHGNFRVPSNNCHPSQELRPYEGVYQPPFSVHSDDCWIVELLFSASPFAAARRIHSILPGRTCGHVRLWYTGTWINCWVCHPMANPDERQHTKYGNMWHVVTLQMIGVGRVHIWIQDRNFSRKDPSVEFRNGYFRLQKKSGMPRWHWTSWRLHMKILTWKKPKTHKTQLCDWKLRMIPSLKLTASLPLKIGLLPQKEAGSSEPTINEFRCYVSFMEGKPPNLWDQFTHTTGRHQLTAPFDPLFVRRCTQLSQKCFTLQLFQAMLLEFSGQRTTKPFLYGWSANPSRATYPPRNKALIRPY